MKQIIVVSNSRVGDNIFHAWNACDSFYIFTQRGRVGVDAARADLKDMYLSVTHAAPKSKIKAFYK